MSYSQKTTTYEYSYESGRQAEQMTNAEMNARIEAIEDRGGDGMGGIDHHHQESSGKNWAFELQKMSESHKITLQMKEQEIQELEEQNRILNEKNIELDGDLKTLQKKYSSEVIFAQKKLKEKTEEFERWKMEDHASDEMKEAFYMQENQNLQRALDEEHHKLHNMEEEMKRLLAFEQQVGRLTVTIREWEIKHKEEKKKSQDFSGQIKILNITIEDLRKQISDMNIQINTYITQINEYKIQIGDFNQNLETWKIKWQEEHDRCEMYVKQIELLNIEIKRLEGEVGRMTIEINQFNVQIGELSVWKSKYESEHNLYIRLFQDYEALKKKFDAEHVRAHEYEEYIEKDKIHDQDINRQLEMYKKQVTVLTREVQVLTEKLTASQTLCATLRGHVITLRAECHYIRDAAMMRIHALADKVKTFCSLQKEATVLLEQWEGLCHVEDIMREEIVMEVQIKTTTESHHSHNKIDLYVPPTTGANGEQHQGLGHHNANDDLAKMGYSENQIQHGHQ